MGWVVSGLLCQGQSDSGGESRDRKAFTVGSQGSSISEGQGEGPGSRVVHQVL